MWSKRKQTVREGGGRTSIHGGASRGAASPPAHWCQISLRSISNPMVKRQGARPDKRHPTRRCNYALAKSGGRDPKETKEQGPRPCASGPDSAYFPPPRKSLGRRGTVLPGRGLGVSVGILETARAPRAELWHPEGEGGSSRGFFCGFCCRSRSRQKISRKRISRG